MSDAAMDAALSDYELERLANIRRNAAVLASLGLGQPGHDLIPNCNPRSSTSNKKRPVTERPEPSRKSSRIAAIPAPAVYVEVESHGGRVRLGGSDAKVVAKTAEHESALQQSPTNKARMTVASDEDPAPDSEDALFASERMVYELLREEKNSIARELDTAAYHVAQNRALMSMVRVLPQSCTELVECWGWGAAKTSAHGERLLGVLRAHIPSLQASREARVHAAAREAGDTEDEQGDGGSDDNDDTEALARRREQLAAAAEHRASRANASSDKRGEREVTVWLGEMPRSEDDLFAHEKEAFTALLEWKRARARELGYNDPCIICHNQTLCELVRTLPRTRPELLKCWGIGPKRAAQHGDLMIDAIAPFRDFLLAARPHGPLTDGDGPSAAAASEAEAEAQMATTSAVSETSLRLVSLTRTRRRAGEAVGRTSSSVRTSTPARAVLTSTVWREDAGAALASEHWGAQRELLNLPSCEWQGRRRRCARTNGCDACARYAAEGHLFSYAPMSQRMIDMLCSEGAYGSALEAHAAGWRWNAQPNHGQSSHAHQWWPPQKVVEEMLPPKTKLPLGTYKAIALLDQLFRGGKQEDESEGELVD
jgi:ribonuclease D